MRALLFTLLLATLSFAQTAERRRLFDYRQLEQDMRVGQNEGDTENVAPETADTEDDTTEGKPEPVESVTEEPKNDPKTAAVKAATGDTTDEPADVTGQPAAGDSADKTEGNESTDKTEVTEKDEETDTTSDSSSENETPQVTPAKPAKTDAVAPPPDLAAPTPVTPAAATPAGGADKDPATQHLAKESENAHDKALKVQQEQSKKAKELQEKKAALEEELKAAENAVLTAQAADTASSDALVTQTNAELEACRNTKTAMEATIRELHEVHEQSIIDIFKKVVNAFSETETGMPAAKLSENSKYQEVLKTLAKVEKDQTEAENAELTTDQNVVNENAETTEGPEAAAETTEESAEIDSITQADAKDPNAVPNEGVEVAAGTCTESALGTHGSYLLMTNVITGGIAYYLWQSVKSQQTVKYDLMEY